MLGDASTRDSAFVKAFGTKTVTVTLPSATHAYDMLAGKYLEIEQVRYGDRLRVEWDIDAAATAARVPPLVLQPLVENAVRHGVEPALEGGRVWIRVAARRGHAVVLIRNTIPDEPSRPGAGMALATVRERLRLLHDVGAQCEVWRERVDGIEQFHARIVVPL